MLWKPASSTASLILHLKVQLVHSFMQQSAFSDERVFFQAMQITEHLTDFSEVQYNISVVQALQFNHTKPDERRNIFIYKTLMASRTQTIY